MSRPVSRRRFLGLTAAGVLGAGGCGSALRKPDPPSSTVDPWNLHAIRAAILKYEERHGHFPPPYLCGPSDRPGNAAGGVPWHSWRVLLLPFLGEKELYAEYRFDEPYSGPNNSKLVGHMPPVYAYRDSHRPGLNMTAYHAAVDDQTMWPRSGCRKSQDILDPPDQTVLVVEIGSGLWTHPFDLGIGGVSVDRPHGWCPDPEVVTVAGTTHRLRRGMSPEAVRAALTVAGGEVLEECEVGWKLPGESGLPQL